MTIVIFAAGMAALVLGANVLVRGASKLALSLGISPLVVGLTVVAFGTSAPEMAVSVGAVLSGRTDIAVGNVVGSNVLNILFILGVSALIIPLVVNVQLIRQEVPIMIGASVLLLVLALDGRLGWTDGAMMFGLMIAYTSFLIVQSRRETREAQAEYDDEVRPAVAGAWDDRWTVQCLLILAGFGLLVVGSNWLVDASVTFARALGVSDVVIGLTVVAFGTSLPEVAASIAAALKGERDIAVGNVVGSNVFNILGCLGISALVAANSGLEVVPSVITFDMWVMIAVALVCLPIFVSGREIARWEGGVLVGFYIAYVAYLVLAQQQHDALPAFSTAMLSFVLPIVLVAIVATLLRPRPAT
jgi:cation:H+ antiporter